MQSFLVISTLLGCVIALGIPTTPGSRGPPGIPISDKYLPFKARYEGSQAAAIRRSLTDRGGEHTGVDVPLSSTTFAAVYSIEVDVGGKNFTVLLDTGTSDLWLKSTNFTCLTPTTLQPTTNCSVNENPFSPTPETFAPLPFANNFNITYATTDNLLGQYGQGPVTLSGITVHDQWFALADRGVWTRESTLDGFMGFAGPGVSFMFNGTDPTKDDDDNKQVVYNPWVYKAAREGLFAPYFSLVMNRPTDAEELSNHTFPGLGAVVLGGIPSESSVPLTGKSTTVTVPTISEDDNPSNPSYILTDDVAAPFPSAYSVSVESFNFHGSANVTYNESISDPSGGAGGPGNWTSLLDSGTGLIIIPVELTRAYNALFDPPAQLLNDTAFYYVLCNATVPPFSVTINKTEFKVDERDSVVREPGLATLFGSDGYCFSGIQSGAVNLAAVYLLGDKFLNNVLTTFHLETNEVTISERKPYGTRNNSSNEHV